MEKFLYKIKKIIPTKLFRLLQPVYHYLLSFLAACFYACPSEKLIVIGVTGTTGKTTSVYIMAKMLQNLGYRVGYTSTAMFGDGKKEWLNDKKMTMVGRFFTQKMLRNMLRNSCQYAIVETTSEGIRQFRHKFINYDILVFTGLYPEHIESHGGFDSYKKAKGKLFEYLKKCKIKYCDEGKNVKEIKNEIKKIDLERVKKTIIVNGDDKHASYFLGFWAEEKFAHLSNANAEKDFEENIKLIKYDTEEPSRQGTAFVVDNEKINLKLLGSFNTTNAMHAVAVGRSQSFNMTEIKNSIERVRGVPGRFEIIDKGQDFTVIVDYAFEPRAVSKLYETLKLIPHKNIIHVLGSCGGGRDEARRGVLGKIAGENAKYVIVTNEDPYDDDPNLIIDQVALGAEYVGKKENIDYFKIIDRRLAIEKSLRLAEKDDIVLITGKGSEQAICVANNKKISWDDRAVAREEILKILKN